MVVELMPESKRAFKITTIETWKRRRRGKEKEDVEKGEKRIMPETLRLQSCRKRE